MKEHSLIDKFIADVDVPEMTAEWLKSWAVRAENEKWNEQQLYYLIDTALVHATIWGDLDTAGLAELHKREQFMGLSFAPQETAKPEKSGKTPLSVAQDKRLKKRNIARIAG